MQKQSLNNLSNVLLAENCIYAHTLVTRQSQFKQLVKEGAKIFSLIVSQSKFLPSNGQVVDLAFLQSLSRVLRGYVLVHTDLKLKEIAKALFFIWIGITLHYKFI